MVQLTVSNWLDRLERPLLAYLIEENWLSLAAASGFSAFRRQTAATAKRR
jgi:hypothetical protein